MTEDHNTTLMPAEIQMLDVMRQGEFEWGSVTSIGIALNENISEDTFAEVAKALFAAQDAAKKGHAASLFRIGDAFNMATDKFGERAYQHVPEGYEHVMSKKQIGRCMWVAKQIAPELRHLENLTWEHHEKVAACDPDQIRKLLDKAENEKLSTADLREEVKIVRPPEPKVKPTKKRGTTEENAPKITEEEAIKAAETLVNYFDQAEEADGPLSKWEADRIERLNNVTHPLEMLAKRIRNAAKKHAAAK